jgi:hypothetical protein
MSCDWALDQLGWPCLKHTTRFLMPDGVAEVKNFMPPPPSTGGTAHRHRVVRRILVVRGQVRFVVDCLSSSGRRRARYGTGPPWSASRSAAKTLGESKLGQQYQSRVR